MTILEAKNMARPFLGLERLLGLSKEESQSIREDSEIFQRCSSEEGQIRKMTLTEEAIPGPEGMHYYKCTSCKQLYFPKVNKIGEPSIIKQNCPQDGETFMEITSEILPDTKGRLGYRCLAKCGQIYVGKEPRQ